MNPSNLKLLELLTVDDAAGTLHFAHRRMLLLDADAMGLLRKELLETLGLERTRRILTRFGYACGYRDALTSKEVGDWRSLAEWWAAGPRLHTLEGVVTVRVLHAQMDPAIGLFDVEAEWRNSYEVEQHRTHIGPSDAPVCWTLTGYASGHSTAVFGREVFYYEPECVGKGDTRCRVIAHAADAADPAVQALKDSYRVENVEVELGRMLEALEQHAKALAQQQVKVSALESQLSSLRTVLHDDNGAGELVGASAAFRQVLQLVERVAPSDATVLLCGETGTGKDLLARALHAQSARREQPLITVNCAALPTGLVESELFGHEKGAFTGAAQRRLGRFEAADGGTLFLDEIGDLPLETQAKLLRVLEHGAFERLGSTHTRTVNVRLVTATNQPLEQLVAAGTFRADLFYRIHVFPIHLPPLRERPEDIELLVHYFAQKYRRRFKKNITAIHPEVLAHLRTYSWPGNVRELEHLIERAVLLADGELLTIDTPLRTRELATVEGGQRTMTRPFTTLHAMERAYISDVLRHTHGRIAGPDGAAEILGLPASTLRHRLKKLGLTPSP
ncbi:MAG TPA: sigma-54-dependent Fis family transcriptional regulator [Rhodothermales bacterium]|nr:sigma-54-dependent Fis family transcriptional regulator [Rhodothermales bacterium]